MIVESLFLAVTQVGDPRFRRVLALGISLTLALLIAVYVAFAWLVGWIVPDSFTLPWIGQITWVDDLASGASVVLMLVLSMFLMVPVAAMFTSLFLDDVTDAVEARHFPGLAPAPRLGFVEGLRQSILFVGVIVAANLAALVLYLIFLPAGPFIFLALNGYLLSREYFQLIAVRRLGVSGARDVRRRHALTIWLMGILMAVPLTVPILNLTVPVMGAAAFTHLFHRLQGTSD